MNIIILYDRLKNIVLRMYRKYVFKHKINCTHSQFSLVENVTLINSNITLGKNVTIYPNVMFFGDGNIDIGNNVVIGNGTIIYASKLGGVTIRDNTIIAAQCYIIDCDHGMNRNKLIRDQINEVSPITIEEDCWIATQCSILKGTLIKKGAVIGANSLVKGEIPEYGVVIGTPGKIIKYRI